MLLQCSCCLFIYWIPEKLLSLANLPPTFHMMKVFIYPRCCCWDYCRGFVTNITLWLVVFIIRKLASVLIWGGVKDERQKGRALSWLTWTKLGPIGCLSDVCLSVRSWMSDQVYRHQSETLICAVPLMAERAESRLKRLWRKKEKKYFLVYFYFSFFLKQTTGINSLMEAILNFCPPDGWCRTTRRIKEMKREMSSRGKKKTVIGKRRRRKKKKASLSNHHMIERTCAILRTSFPFRPRSPSFQFLSLSLSLLCVPGKV